MRIALVAAVAENGVIGTQGRLAWRISDDLKWFKSVTMGKPVVMGRKTFDSIGRALPGRDNIVVTRSKDFAAPGVIRALSVEAALSLASAAAEKAGASEVCVIGGGELYRQTLAGADRIYLTRVAAQVDGDVRFPDLYEAGWQWREAGGCEAGEKNQHSCRFFILDRLPAALEPAKGDTAKSS